MKVFIVFVTLFAVSIANNCYLYNVCGTCVINNCVYIQLKNREYRCTSWTDYKFHPIRRSFRTLVRCNTLFQQTITTTPLPTTDDITTPNGVAIITTAPPTTLIPPTTSDFPIEATQTTSIPIEFTTFLSETLPKGTSVVSPPISAPRIPPTHNTIELTVLPTFQSNENENTHPILTTTDAVFSAKSLPEPTPSKQPIQHAYNGNGDTHVISSKTVAIKECQCACNEAANTASMPTSEPVQVEDSFTEKTKQEIAPIPFRNTPIRACKQIKDDILPEDDGTLSQALRCALRRFRIRSMPLTERALRREIDRHLCRLAYLYLVYHQTWNLKNPKHLKMQIYNPMNTPKGISKKCFKYKNIKL